MNRDALLAAFDAQLRRDPPPEGRDGRVERTARVTRCVGGADGWSGVTWSDLDESNADAVIAEQCDRFRELSRDWEWKHYSYDQPADLPKRLREAGFTAQPAETVLVAEIAGLDLEVAPPPGVELHQVTDAAGVNALVRVHDIAFGGDHAHTGRALLSALEQRSETLVAVVATAGATPVSSARIEFNPGTEFAGLWGGGTVPDWRGRGIFRALVAYRARLGAARGYRYLQVDASAESRPILGRLGFTELATTTPYEAPSR